jgi:hypothetical protein
LAEQHKTAHVEVDEENGPEWAHLLYKQQMQQANSLASDRVFEMFDTYSDMPCERYTVVTDRPCGGQTCITAFNEGPLNARLFIGCSRWKGRESGHTLVHLTNCDIAKTLRVWGKERVKVHDDILEAIRFDWDSEDLVGTLKLLKHSYLTRNQFNHGLK